MSIKENIIGDVAVLMIRGSLMGGDETDALRDKIYGLIEDKITKVVIDLGKVKWINSTGLGSILSGHTTLVNNGGKLNLARSTEKVQSLLMITQLMKVFENYDSVDDAVKAFQE
jgi:anti-sigma B factor antagonist